MNLNPKVDLSEWTSTLFESLDRNRNGTLERSELDDFARVLSENLKGQTVKSPGTTSLFGRLAASDSPEHELKALLNSTLEDVAKELGLRLTTLEGSRYSAVAELVPDSGNVGPTAAQAEIRRQITDALVRRLASDPALPPGMEVFVENPHAASGADRVGFRVAGSEPLVFDVITGSGILKARIAKNYLAERAGLPVSEVHDRQLQLMGRIARTISASALAFRS